MAVKFTAIKSQSLLEYPFIFQKLEQAHKNKSVFVCIGCYIIAHDDYRVLANEYNQLLKKFPASLLWQLVGLERAPV